MESAGRHFDAATNRWYLLHKVVDENGITERTRLYDDGEITVDQIGPEKRDHFHNVDSARLDRNADEFTPAYRRPAGPRATTRPTYDANALARKLELVTEAESLAESRDVRAARERVRTLFDRWKTEARLDRQTDDELWRRLTTVNERLKQRAAEERAARERERAAAAAVKQRLVDRADRLARSTDWKATGDEFRTLMNEWRAARKCDRDTEQLLWDRFQRARTAFVDARTRHFEQIKQAQDQARAAKQELVRQARSVAESGDLKSARESMARLKERWKSSPRAAKADEDRLWNEFSAARDRLHQRGETLRRQREQEETTNRRRKEALCHRAEMLAGGGPDWRAAKEQLRALQQEWRTVGRAGRDHDDALWKRFSAAGDRLRANAAQAAEQRRREASQRLQDAIFRRRQAAAATQDRIHDLDRRLSELRGRPDPKWSNPNRWEIVAKRSAAISNAENKKADLQGRLREMWSQIADMESKLRSMN
ncbi:DUF349 domain-containing protein [Micromonospora echinofusca]|uniref:DUF349 domain-containing protein n=1 Tax=Micromonospora echinofusca TaxID=47858 RepID=A0ABS3VNL2_MICEH|nr:DUF349 domain-containing protein [Micromonospora echinofusca]MBO4206114.1 DUF349 domain-containing protein [Micromonospora echinofusca]